MATILRRLLAEEDDCAPDAYYQWDKDVLKHTDTYNPNIFKKAAVKCTNPDDGIVSYLLHHPNGRIFEIEWSHDDPYWKLYEHIETTSVKVKL